MKLSTRVRYAVRALTELARQDHNKYVPLRKLAASQQLSMKYLEQMAVQLKIAGILQSVRGAEGGYRLAKSPSEITIWDIYSVLDVATELVDCRNSNCADGMGECSRTDSCAARELWHDLSTAVKEVLESRTLAQMAQREDQIESLQST
ncbi:MAG: Rrf2 family transcriptional regulator [Sedimentisphaerales bacterium]|nr:Rrf2 family transcriptional regulator [Sedimentisphaerales bacterium]